MVYKLHHWLNIGQPIVNGLSVYQQGWKNKSEEIVIDSLSSQNRETSYGHTREKKKKKKHRGPIRDAYSSKAIPCHPEVLYLSSLVAHLIIIVVLVVLAALVFLIVILIVLHLIRGDLGVVNDLAACASATLNDVALVDRVVEIVLCVIFFVWEQEGSVWRQLMVILAHVVIQTWVAWGGDSGGTHHCQPRNTQAESV